MAESRVKKSLLNARVSSIFYILTLALSFFSRKVFLENLGDDFIGLTGTLYDFLGFLNLAEMGIGTAVSFNLYKPLQVKNYEKINNLVSLFGYFYRKVGIFIGLAGLAISFFFPLIFKTANIGMFLIFVTFYSFVGSQLISYLINYRQIVLSADQRQYVVTGYYQTAFLAKIALQMVLAYLYKNLYVWVLLEFLFSWIACIILNWKINVTYPWLKVNLSEGKSLMKQYPEILKSTKQVFIHSLKNFAVGRCDQMFVFLYVSLGMVAHYGNYTLIITRTAGLFNSVLGSTGASIGNLVAEGDHDKIMKVFWELVTIQFLVAGFLFTGYYFLIEPFITLWLGSKYIMSFSILLLLILIDFLGKSLGTVNSFNNAYGNYGDIWSVWVEMGLFVGITILTAPHWGIIGILLGRFSVLIFQLCWKPYYLFSAGIKASITIFWKGYLRNLLAFLFAFSVMFLLQRKISIELNNFLIWVIYAFVLMLVFSILYVSSLLLVGKGMRTLIFRVPIYQKISNIFH